MSVNCGLAPGYGVGWQGFGSQGLIVPLNAGTINTFLAGSSTPATTYIDSAGTTANPNPIVLNSDGRPPNEIWLDLTKSYKFVIQDSASNVIATQDNIVASGSLVGLTGGAGVDASGAPGNLSPFALLHTAPGYQKLPSGLYLQWGFTSVITAGSSIVVTLPIAFPNAGLIAVVSPLVAAGSATPQSVGSGTPTTTQLTIYALGAANVQAAWMAVGR